MTKLQKILFGIVAVITVMLLFTVASLVKAPSVGGVYNNVQPDFSKGVLVNGTQIIDSTGAWVGTGISPVSTTTGTFSAAVTVGTTLGVTGITTLADDLVGGSSSDIAINSTKFNVTASSGNLSINTNKFTVAGSSGNTLVAGTFNVTGTTTLADDLIGGSSVDILINTNKFTVAASTGNTVIAGTLTLGSSSDIAVNTNKFTVAASSGNTVVAGTFSAAGASTIGAAGAGLNYYKKVINETIDATASVGQTGSILQMGTAGVDITLPGVAVSSGVHYRFVVSANFATTAQTIVSAEGDNIQGSLMVAGAIVDCPLADVVTISATNENIGDFVDLYSDGVYWYVGASNALASSVLACSG